MIQKFCYHGNVTSHFFALLYDAGKLINWTSSISWLFTSILTNLKKCLYVTRGIKIILGKLILSTKQLLSSIASFSFSFLKNRIAMNSSLKIETGWRSSQVILFDFPQLKTVYQVTHSKVQNWLFMLHEKSVLKLSRFFFFCLIDQWLANVTGIHGSVTRHHLFIYKGFFFRWFAMYTIRIHVLPVNRWISLDLFSREEKIR